MKKSEQVSLLNLHVFILDKHVRKKIIGMLTPLDRKIVWMAHCKKREEIVKDDKAICTECAASGHIGLLLWSLERGCKWDLSTLRAAAAAGQLKILKKLTNLGCPRDVGVAAAAAQAGHMNILEWGMSNKTIVFDRWTCAYAAKGNQLHVLKWLRANNVPWDSNTAIFAKVEGNVHVLEWCKQNGLDE